MTTNKKERPKFTVGVNVFVFKDDKLLLWRRKNTDGHGMWGLPGGHVELNDAMNVTAERGLKEETGLSASEFELTNLVNQFTHSECDHCIQVGMMVLDAEEAEPQLCEPDRCSEWSFFDLNDLTEPIFYGYTQQIENLTQKNNFTDQ